jgi:hypothetical protein
MFGVAVDAVSAVIFPPPPAPTPNLELAIHQTADASVFVAFSQTAQALPTGTETALPSATDTIAPSPTDTFVPTDTPIPTFTNMPVIIPTNLPASNHPPGTTGQCVDGTYTSAQHSQGACSHHRGLLHWWGP